MGTLVKRVSEFFKNNIFMPRKARLDVHGVLHHFMIRGIERRKIFLNDSDRQDFLDRLVF